MKLDARWQKLVQGKLKELAQELDNGDLHDAANAAKLLWRLIGAAAKLQALIDTNEGSDAD